MSLERFAAEMIMGWAAHNKQLGAVAMLGRQHQDLTCINWASSIEKRLGFKIQDLMTDQEDVFAESFLLRVGASSVESIDFSSYQGATHIHDMNNPLPSGLEGKFDLLHDGGTMEHVFNTPTYLANCMKLLRVGGVYVGVVPANDWMGHGFYQFSPELICRVFSPANGFRLQALGLGTWERKGRVYQILDEEKWRGRLEPNLSRKTLLLIIAQKVANVEPFSSGWPQQSDYASRWATHRETNQTHSIATPKKTWKGRLSSLLPDKLRRILRYELTQRRYRRQRNAMIVEVSSADLLIKGLI